MLTKSRIAVALGLALACGVAQAIPTTTSSGDLGNNIIDDAGLFEISLLANTPSNSLAASLDVKYGLWNSPSVSVSVFVNSSLVGSFDADAGYLSPGPEFISLDVTGLLIDGLNTISFNGFGANTGDYVVGQVDLNYDNSGPSVSVPEPGSLALVLAGLAGLATAKRRIRKTAP